MSDHDAGAGLNVESERENATHQKQLDESALPPEDTDFPSKCFFRICAVKVTPASVFWTFSVLRFPSVFTVPDVKVGENGNILLGFS